MKLHTFFVEDNLTIRENLIATLEELTGVQSMGHSISEAGAIEWFSHADGAWQLAIIDLFLAQGNGLGVVAALQGRDHHQKVVVLSNYATPEMRERCLQLGADAVFDKSNDIDSLLDYCDALGGGAAL